MKVVHINKAKIKKEQALNDMSEELQAHWRRLIRRRVRKTMGIDDTTKTTTYGTKNTTI